MPSGQVASSQQVNFYPSATSQPISPPATSIPHPRETALCLFDSEIPLWNAIIPHELSHHVFLRHMMASLNALYLANNTTNYDDHISSPVRVLDARQLSHFHQLEGSRDFRKDVRVLTEDNWLASMLFGIALMAFHFQSTEALQPQSAHYDPLTTVSILRHSAPLARAVEPWLLNSPIFRMIRRDKTALSCLDEQYVTAILNLYTLLDVEAFESPTETLLACRDAVRALHRWLFVTSGQPQTWRDFIEWPAAVSDEFLLLLRQDKHPVAIAVFLHWCAIMQNAPKTWFLDGWAASTASRVFGWLDESWRDDLSLVWVREELAI